MYTGASVGKESACNAGDLGLIPGLGRSSGEGTGNPLHYSCLENSMDKRTWWATIHGLTMSQMQLCDFPFLSFCVHCCVNICNWLFLTRVFLSVGLEPFPLYIKAVQTACSRDVFLDRRSSFSLDWHQWVLRASLHIFGL